MYDCHFSYITKLGKKTADLKAICKMKLTWCVGNAAQVMWSWQYGNVELATYQSHFCKVIKWMCT
jgi:hypothetical protein